MIPKVLALISLFVFSAPAHAGPFGVDVEKFAPEAYGCVLDADPSSYVYTCESFPKPHPGIGLYKAMYINEVGLCAIFAFAPAQPTPSSGRLLRSRVDSISEQLFPKYGPSVKIDKLQNGSLWTEEQYWMMGLLKQERTYAYYWNDISPPVDGIVTVIMNSWADSLDTGSFLVSFHTINGSKCDEAKEKSDASSF